MKRILKNDRGFSLVELIVSLAILVIIAAAAMSFLAAGSRAYGSVTSGVTLQFEAQTTMTQLEEYIIDCNYGVVCADGGRTLYVVCREGDAPALVAHKFFYDAGDKCIYYQKYVDGIATGDSGLMSSRVTDFTVTVPPAADPTANRWAVASVTVSIDYQLGGKSYSGKETVALRNPVTAATSLDELSAVE